MHYALDKVESHHSGRILKLFKAIEHLFDAWMDTRETRLIEGAMTRIQPKTFTQPRRDPK